MPPFRKLRPGSEFNELSAGDYNAMIDAAKAYAESRGSFASKAPQFERSQTQVKIQNNSGDDLAEMGILGIDGPIFGPDDNANEFRYRFALEGSTPDAAKHTGKFAIAIGPLGSGRIGPAVVSGIAVCQVKLTSPDDQFADITDGETDYLTSGSSGAAQILWSADGDGPVWALVRLGAGGGDQTRIVAIDDGSSSAGTQIGPAGDCVWPGKLVGLSSGSEDFCSDPWTPTPTIDGVTLDEVDIYIAVIDNPGGSGTAGLKMTQGDRFIGRYLDQYTLGGDTRPLYAIRKGAGPLVRFELYTDLTFGVGSAQAYPLRWNGSTWAVDTSAAPFTVYDPFVNSYEFTGKGVATVAGYQGWCQLQPDSGLYEIVHLEGQARWIEGTLYQQLKTTDASQASCTLVNYWDGRNPDPAAAGITVYNDAGFFGPTGAKFLAFWADSGPGYKLVWVQRQAQFAYVTLANPMSSGSSAGATVNSFWNGKDPGPTITVYDPNNFFRHALTSAVLLVTFNEQANAGAGQYETVEGFSQAGEIAFKLTAAMSSGSATASLQNSTGQAGAWGTQQDSQAPVGTITVYDPFGSTGLYQFCPSNALGTAIYDTVNNKYWIASCQQKSRFLSGSISSLTSSVGASTTMTVSVAHDGISPGGSVTVYDTDGNFGTISSSTKCKAYFNPDDGKYYLLWVAC